MDSVLLKKLSGIFWDRYYARPNQYFSEDDWDDLCDKNGVARKFISELDVDFCVDGYIFEEFLIIPDRWVDGNRWLEMSHEVAMKILMLGLI